MVWKKHKKRIQRKLANQAKVEQMPMVDLGLCEALDTDAIQPLPPLPTIELTPPTQARPTEATGAVPKVKNPRKESNEATTPTISNPQDTKRGDTEPHTITSNTLPLIPTIELISPQRARPTENTGAIPKNKSWLNEYISDAPPIRPRRSRKFRSPRYPLPGESSQHSQDETIRTTTDEGNRYDAEELLKQGTYTNTLSIPPKNTRQLSPGATYEEELRKMKPRMHEKPSRFIFRPPVYRQAPIYENVSQISDRRPPIKMESLTSALASCVLSGNNTNELSMQHKPLKSTSTRSSWLSFLELASKYKTPNQLNGPYNPMPKSPIRSIDFYRRIFEDFFAADQSPEMRQDLSHNDAEKDTIPSTSDMSMSMNPNYIEDAVDFVEVYAGQKSAAEEKRLSALITENGTRSSSMPPLQMPRRIVHGNISHSVPAYSGVKAQPAIPIAPFLRRCSREERSPSSVGDFTSTSTSSDQRSRSSDSGCVDSTSAESLSEPSFPSSLFIKMLPLYSSRIREDTPEDADKVVHNFMERLFKAFETEPDICFECKKPILLSENACLAMGHKYHESCFKCALCEEPLSGKTFYNTEEKFYCHEDYYRHGIFESAKKCAECQQTIHDLVVLALRKSFHPNCFRCFYCNKKLDGVNFTANSDGQPYCDPCFHEKYSPKCTSCGSAILPAVEPREVVRVLSRDMEYHYDCYRCLECKTLLASEEVNECYPLGLRLFCLACNRLCQQREGESFVEPIAVSCTHV